MADAQKIVEVSIRTRSTEPLRGSMEIGTQSSTITFELDDELACRLCTDLERFLTQAPRQDPSGVRLD